MRTVIAPCSRFLIVTGKFDQAMSGKSRTRFCIFKREQLIDIEGLSAE